MAPFAPRRRRARPVADAPIDPLLADTERLAKAWLVALLEQAPLQRATAILSDELTRDGPRVCDAAVRALGDDADLHRLQEGGALRPLAGRIGEMAGAAADGPAAVSAAVETLREVIWEALHDELHGPEAGDGELVDQLARRLALVCEVIREAALTATASVSAPAPGTGAGRPSLQDLSATSEPTPWGPRTRPPGPSGPPDVARVEAGSAGSAGLAGSGGSAELAGLAGSAGMAGSAGSAGLAGSAGSGDFADAMPLWRSALEDEVGRAHGGPLALLLAELEDADRVLASASPERARVALDQFSTALREAVRRQDLLASESSGRAWVIARDTSRAGALALARRIVDGVGEARGWAGAPLIATVGIALLGEDGDTSEELIEAAEEARFDASSRGIDVSRRVPD